MSAMHVIQSLRMNDSTELDPVEIIKTIIATVFLLIRLVITYEEPMHGCMVTSASCTAHCLLRLKINRRRECCAPFRCHPLARQRLSTGLIMSSISPPYFLPLSFIPSFQMIALKHHSLVDARAKWSFAHAICWTDQQNAEAEIFGENWHFCVGTISAVSFFTDSSKNRRWCKHSQSWQSSKIIEARIPRKQTLVPCSSIPSLRSPIQLINPATGDSGK